MKLSPAPRTRGYPVSCLGLSVKLMIVCSHLISGLSNARHESKLSDAPGKLANVGQHGRQLDTGRMKSVPYPEKITGNCLDFLRRPS